MQIAVISDTHMGDAPSWLDHVYEKWLGPADYLIHCGDITSPRIWSYFMQHENFICVRGNCDWDPQLVDQLETNATVDIAGLTVGAVHGWGSRSEVAVKVAQAFGPSYDLVCYGHTHKRDWSVVEGVQLCNPGSLGEFRSLALVNIDGTSLSCEFIDAL